MLNLLLSFVVFMIATISRFIMSFKLPLGFGLVVYLLLSGMASAEASELVTQCGNYGQLTVDQCNQMKEYKFEKFLACLSGVLTVFCALSVYKQEKRKKLEEFEERNKFFN